MFRQIIIFCITIVMVLSAVSYSQAEDESQAPEVFNLIQNVERSTISRGRGGVGYGDGGGYGGEELLFGRGGYGGGRMGAGHESPGRKVQDRLRAAQQHLAKAEGEDAKQGAIAEVREALGAYFDVDLDRRQSELAAIKKRVAEMEGQLQKRVDAREDIIALRLQVLLNDADGLGWLYTGFKENTDWRERGSDSEIAESTRPHVMATPSPPAEPANNTR